jgi:hypothetical protein
VRGDSHDAQPKAEDLMQTQKALDVIGALVCASVMTIGSAAMAQGKPAPVELSSTQIETNNQAVRLLSETPPQTKKAIKLVEAALLMEKRGDLLHLTLGRAYQLDGQCALAEEQFAAAELAPGVKGVPEDFVPGQLAEYRSELDACMGTLLIACEPDDLELVINDALLACDTQVSLEPGVYKIEVRNPGSGDTLELPVQIVGGQMTRSELKLGTKETAVVTPPPEEEDTSGTTWRVTPHLGFGLTVNVLEALDTPQGVSPGSLDFVGDSSFLLGLGVEGRVLTGTHALRYGVGWDARFEFWPGDDRGNYAPNDVTVRWGAKLALHGQVWWSSRVGLYVGGAWRPRAFRVGVCDMSGDVCVDDQTPRGEEVDFFITSPAFGGGAKLELGDLIGLQGLELTAGWMQPLGGSPKNVVGERSVPVLELGVRAQVHQVSIGFGFEAWHGESDAAGVVSQERAYNLRAQQGLLTVGWTLGQ